MDYLRIIAGVSSYLVVLIIGLVMYAVSLRQARRVVARDTLSKKEKNIFTPESSVRLSPEISEKR